MCLYGMDVDVDVKSSPRKTGKAASDSNVDVIRRLMEVHVHVCLWKRMIAIRFSLSVFHADGNCFASGYHKGR